MCGGGVGAFDQGLLGYGDLASFFSVFIMTLCRASAENVFHQKNFSLSLTATQRYGVCFGVCLRSRSTLSGFQALSPLSMYISLYLSIYLSVSNYVTAQLCGCMRCTRKIPRDCYPKQGTKVVGT